MWNKIEVRILEYASSKTFFQNKKRKTLAFRIIKFKQSYVNSILKSTH